MKIRRFCLLICISLSLVAGITACGTTNNADEPKEKVNDGNKPQLNCSISRDMEFGSTQFVVEPEAFQTAGFAFGDSCDLKFSNGAEYEDIPFYNGYYGKTGELAIVAYPGYEYNVFARCMGNSVWDEAGFKDGDTVTVTLNEKGKYTNTQNALSMTYSDSREDYADDATFANFRVMKGGNLKADTFYRGASPVDNQHNRAGIANMFIEDKNINFVLDLADTDEKIADYRSSEDFESEYAAALYDSGRMYVAGLSAGYRNDDYAAKTVAMLNEMTKHEGPYYIHCTEGKDRTGFICMLLGSVAGWTYDELKADYMKTYENYYGISLENNRDKYISIVDVKFNDMLFWLAGIDKEEDATPERLEAGARDYLLRGGMSDEEYQELVDVLTKGK